MIRPVSECLTRIRQCIAAARRHVRVKAETLAILREEGVEDSHPSVKRAKAALQAALNAHGQWVDTLKAAKEVGE